MYSRFFSFTLLAAIFATAFAQDRNCLSSPTPSPPPCDPTACNIGPVCYVVDQSDSITAEEYQREQHFVSRFALQANNKSATAVSNSLVVFSTQAQLIQAPTTDLSQFQAAVQTDRLFYESTNISAALSMCKRQLDCAGGNGTIVLVTDGQTSPAGKELTEAVVQDIKSNGINLITAGIGCDANVDFLKDIATSPDLFINLNNERPCGSAINALQAICVPEECPPQETTGPCVPISCQQAFDRCEYTFAGKNGLATFDATARADVSFTPMIISKNPNVHLGVLNMNNLIPEFIDESGVKEIIHFGSQPFTPTHFKPYWIEGTRGSGIGHQMYHGNQRQLARNRCVRVSFSHIQLLDNTVNLNEAPDNQCVVFRTN